MSRSIWKGPFTDLIKNIIPKKGQQVKQKSMSLQKQESLPGTTSWQAGPVGIATFPYQVKPSGKAADSAFPLVSEEAALASSETRGNAVMGREGAEKRIFKKVRIWSRRSQIMPLDVGKSVHVHNGRNFIGVKCVESMCSHKWGEFAVTRKKPVHKFNKKKQLHKTPYKKVHS